jgi:hypothetical protein
MSITLAQSKFKLTVGEIRIIPVLARPARFFSVQHTETGKIGPNGRLIWQHLPFQDPPKFTQIGIFGLKICHLATLVVSRITIQRVETFNDPLLLGHGDQTCF